MAPVLADAEADQGAQPAPSLWPPAADWPRIAPMAAPAHLMAPAPPTAPEPPARREPPVAPQRTPGKPVPRMAPGVGGPNLDWRPPPRIDWPSPASRLPPFEGDLAVKALRQRLSLDPELLPEPPIRARPKSVLPFLSRFCLVAVVAAVVAYGVTLLSMPDLRPISIKRDKVIPDLGIVAATEPALSSAGSDARPGTAGDRGAAGFANETAPLGVSLNGASGGEFALLSGLAAGTRLSVGASFGGTGWRGRRATSPAPMYAPKDFVGVMDAAIDLRTSRDTLVDRNVMRLEWIGKQPELRSPQLRPGPDEPGQIVPVIQPIGGG